MYEHVEFKAGSPGLLLMWWNNPAVVIGRHQNPWVECSVNTAAELGVDLVRRNSGGGAVYHDLGNLNCCFMGHKADYNRKRNLKTICDALQSSWGVKATISDRDDVLVQDAFKISGTAAKISHNTAYHHCTVLVDVNTSVLHQVLGSRFKHFESKATSSVRALVRNLRELCPSITVESLAEAVGQAFNGPFSTGRDASRSLEPADDLFPGVESAAERLRGWDWVFGMTPRFTVFDSFRVPRNVESGVDVGDGLHRAVVKISLTVYRGKIEDARFVPRLRDPSLEAQVKKSLEGVRFVQEDVRALFARSASRPSEETDVLKFVGDCVCALVGKARR